MQATHYTIDEETGRYATLDDALSVGQARLAAHAATASHIRVHLDDGTSHVVSRVDENAPLGVNIDLPSPLHRALDAHVSAKNTLEAAADTSLREVVARYFPTATSAQVTATLDPAWTEHNLEVFNADGERLDREFDWTTDPEIAGWLTEDWFNTVTEGVAPDGAATLNF